MKRFIKWSYWQNPLGGGSEWVDEDQAKVPDEDTVWGEEEDDNKKPVRPVVPTPIGLIPVHVFGNFAANCEFWMGSANFDITPPVGLIIEATPGVEIFDVVTRYRFRIAVGPCFKFADVKIAIEEALDATPPARNEENPLNLKLDEGLRDKVRLLEQQSRERFPYWAIYVVPNGDIAFDGYHSQEEALFEDKLDLYRNAQKLAGGIIFTSHENQ
jgi:hypothetical protein